MLRNYLPLCLLAAMFAVAQVKSSGSPAAGDMPAGKTESSQRSAVTASTVPPDAAVLTIKGLCSEPGASSAGANPACTTVVTRAQFERLVTILRADKDPQSRQQLSTAYPQILTMARIAEERGLDKQPDVIERLNFSRLQILSRELISQIREEAAQVPQKDIEDYYRKNTSQFDQISLQRIVVPLRAQAKPDAKETAAVLDENGMTRLADALRVRAAAGEDFTKLQKEAYDAAGLSGNDKPDPRMENIRRRGLPPTHASVFDLKPGEVSPVISDVTGHYIYKVESKQTEPLEAVKNEISNVLRRQRLEDMIHQVEQPYTTDINRAYFKAEAAKPGKD